MSVSSALASHVHSTHSAFRDGAEPLPQVHALAQKARQALLSHNLLKTHGAERFHLLIFPFGYFLWKGICPGLLSISKTYLSVSC